MAGWLDSWKRTHPRDKNRRGEKWGKNICGQKSNFAICQEDAASKHKEIHMLLIMDNRTCFDTVVSGNKWRCDLWDVLQTLCERASERANGLAMTYEIWRCMYELGADVSDDVTAIRGVPLSDVKMNDPASLVSATDKAWLMHEDGTQIYGGTGSAILRIDPFTNERAFERKIPP